MKKRLLVGFLLVILIIGFFSLILAQEQDGEISYGPNWETVCESGICQTIVYSYEKYWIDETGNYEEIDESWHSCPEGYCTNEYHFNVIANSNGIVSSFLDNEEFTVGLSNFMDLPLNFNPTVEGSILTYEDIIPNYVDLRYQYLPRILKEEIVIKQPIPNLPEQDFDISFTKSGNAAFDVLPSTICDANDICQIIEHTITNDQIIITIPTSFLSNPETEYPVIIDPTITLDDSDEIWDGYVKNDSGTYTRILAKYSRVGRPNSTLEYRGGIHWNISTIPDNSNIIDLNLSLYINVVTCHEGSCIDEVPNLRTRHMEGDETTYPNNATGNEQFFDDMGNGTLYDAESIAIGFTGHVDLLMYSEAMSDFENSLGEDEFSFGFRNSVLKTSIGISGKSWPTASKRPKLTVTYGANETDSDDAIEQGINNSLVGPNNPIETDQQIYLLNETGGHFLGTFDKSTVKNNQTWAFNYVTSSESFINMPSLFNILNVWENQSLTFDEIVSQVETFINNTII